MRSDLLWPYIVTNLTAVALVVCSWKRPRIARIAYFLLFGISCWINAYFALRTPEVYIRYADTAVFRFYVDFIHGFFRQQIVPIILAVAVCQLCIGIAMLLKGALFRLGAIGGILFLFAISPLGVGSAFPSTLIMAAGFFILLMEDGATFVWEPLPKTDLKLPNPR